MPMIFSSILLDKTITKPLYEQLVDGIKQAIKTQAIKHHDRLPTENELCALFHMSPTVVKQAYKKLRDEGLIETVKGRGTYLTTRPFLLKDLNTFFYLDDPLTGERELTGKTILVERQKPQNSPGRRLLNIAPNKANYLLKKVFFYDYFPVIYVEYYYPESLFPKFTEAPYHDKSLFDLIEGHYHHPIDRYDSTFSAGTLSESIALALDTKKGAVSHTIRTKVMGQNEEVLACVLTYIPGEYLAYEVKPHDAR